MDDPNLTLEIQRLEEQYAAHPGSLLFARLADLRRKAGDLDRALSVVEEGLREHPDYLSAHIVHARALEDLGRDVQARAAYRAVLDLDAQNLVALGALARLADTSGDRDVATGWYERLLAVDPRNEEAEAALERLEEGPAVTAGAWSEPEAEVRVEPEDRAEAEPEEPDEVQAGVGDEDELDAEGAPEPESISRADVAGTFGTEWGEWAGESGPTDAFGLEAEAADEAEPEPIGSSGWPWREAADTAPPEPDEAGESEAAHAEQLEPRPEEPGSEGVTVSEGAAAELWPEWGGEAVEAGAPWDLGGDQEEMAQEGPVAPEEPAEITDAGASGADSVPDGGASAIAEVEETGIANVDETEIDEAEIGEAAFGDAETGESGPVEAEDAEPAETVAIRPEAEEDPDTDLPTETLATLYATQGLYREAVTIYEELVRRRPQDDALAERLRAAREELGTDLPERGGVPAPGEPPVREHLRALLRGEAVPDAARGSDPD